MMELCNENVAPPLKQGHVYIIRYQLCTDHVERASEWGDVIAVINWYQYLCHSESLNNTLQEYLTDDVELAHPQS